MRFSALAAAMLALSLATSGGAQDAAPSAPAAQASLEAANSGGDIIVTANSRAEPLTNPGSWLTAYDFPKIAMDKHHEGIVGYRLTVGPQGRVTACDIVRSSGFPELDEATCRPLIQRARFRAGRGETWFAGEQRWIVPLGVVEANRDMVMERMAEPMRAPRPRQDLRSWVRPADYPAKARRDGTGDSVEFWLEVDTRGKVKRCATTGGNAGTQMLEGETCRLLTERASFWPALDRNGTPMPGVYRDRMSSLLAPTPGKTESAADMAFAIDAVPVGWRSPIVLKADILVGADGRIEDCRFQSIVAATHSQAYGQQAVSLIPLGELGCRFAVGRPASRPAAGKDGKAIRSMQSLTFRFTRGGG